jgi:pyruvate-formate lyase-activating enzyme
MPEVSGIGIESLLRFAIRRLPTPIRRRLQALRRGRATPLHEILPLPLPESMHIDPANACNFRCAFCPTGDQQLLTSVGRPAGIMDFDLFTRIIDDLTLMVRRSGRKLWTLHLYKDGEPLLNRRFLEMAAYAKRARVADIVATTTNASLLTEDVSRKLVTSGCDQIRISVIHVGSDRYRELTRTYSDYERILSNVAFLYDEKKRRRPSLRVLVKINDTGLTEEERAKFRNDFGPISDELRIDSLMGWSLSDTKDFTLGVPVSSGMDGVSPLRERQVCPEPFSRLAVNFDGQVSVCCVDWSFGTIVGDLRRESLADVWNGERLRRFRLAHLEGRRGEIPACANCQYMTGEAPQRDLDAQTEALIPLYEAHARRPPGGS